MSWKLPIKKTLYKNKKKNTAWSVLGRGARGLEANGKGIGKTGIFGVVRGEVEPENAFSMGSDDCNGPRLG